jgi:hypothetical protein
MNSDDISDLAHRVLRVSHGISNQLGRLQSQLITRTEHLLGTVECGLDFASLDEVSAALDKAIRKHGPDFLVRAEGAEHSLAGLRDLIQGALSAVEPYREARRK